MIDPSSKTISSAFIVEDDSGDTNATAYSVNEEQWQAARDAALRDAMTREAANRRAFIYLERRSLVYATDRGEP